MTSADVQVAQEILGQLKTEQDLGDILKALLMMMPL